MSAFAGPGSDWSHALTADENAIVRVLEDIIEAAGDISPDEIRLLTVIADRLERLNRSRGHEAAMTAARRIRQIWLQAIEDDEDLSGLFLAS